MTIEAMTASDIPAVAKLAKQLGYEATNEEFLSRMKALESEGTAGLFVGRDTNDTIVGWVHVQRSQISLLSETYMEIQALVVDESCRSNGYGKQLLSHAEAWAFEQGTKKILLRSNIIRKEAHRFYSREGYTTTKTSHIFEKLRK